MLKEKYLTDVWDVPQYKVDDILELARYCDWTYLAKESEEDEFVFVTIGGAKEYFYSMDEIIEYMANEALEYAYDLRILPCEKYYQIKEKREQEEVEEEWNRRYNEMKESMML